MAGCGGRSFSHQQSHAVACQHWRHGCCAGLPGHQNWQDNAAVTWQVDRRSVSMGHLDTSIPCTLCFCFCCCGHWIVALIPCAFRCTPNLPPYFPTVPVIDHDEVHLKQSKYHSKLCSESCLLESLSSTCGRIRSFHKLLSCSSQGPSVLINGQACLVPQNSSAEVAARGDQLTIAKALLLESRGPNQGMTSSLPIKACFLLISL